MQLGTWWHEWAHGLPIYTTVQASSPCQDCQMLWWKATLGCSMQPELLLCLCQPQALGITGAATHLVGRIPYFSMQPNLLTDVLQVGIFPYYTCSQSHWPVFAAEKNQYACSACRSRTRHSCSTTSYHTWLTCSIVCLLRCSMASWAWAVQALLCCCMRVCA